MESNHSCEFLWDLLSAYADGQTTRDEAVQVEGHIASCVECARDLAFLRETATLLSGTPEIAPPTGLRQAILAATVHRPTWSQRVREMAGRWLPARPIRGLALAGSAAAVLLAAYLFVPRTPKPDPGMQPVLSIREPKSGAQIAANQTPPPIRLAPTNIRKNPPPGNERKAMPPPVHRPADDTPEFVDALVRQPIRVVVIKKRSPRNRLEPSPAPHLVRNVTHRSLTTDIAPSLLPDRDAPPNDMFTGSPMETADIKEPIAKSALGDPMSKGTGSAHDSSAPMSASPQRNRIIALVSNTPEPSNAGAMVSLADLRRKLRQQNETVQIVHPELHLRGQHDTLDLLKSTF